MSEVTNLTATVENWNIVTTGIEVILWVPHIQYISIYKEKPKTSMNFGTNIARADFTNLSFPNSTAGHLNPNIGMMIMKLELNLSKDPGHVHWMPLKK